MKENNAAVTLEELDDLFNCTDSNKLSPVKSYGYTLTIFDPQDKFSWADGVDPYKATDEELLDLMNKALSPFTAPAKNHKKRDPETNGAMVGCEISHTGKFHMHVFLFSENKLKLNSVKKLYPNMHIEPVRGSAQDCWNYLLKAVDGKHSKKADTKLTDPIRWGSWFQSGSDLRSNTDARPDVNSEIDRLLDNGTKPYEIIAQGISYGARSMAIYATYSARKRQSAPRIRKPMIVYHYGGSGTGKSYAAYDRKLVQNPDEDICLLTASEHTFDDYHQESYVVIEEIRGENFKPNDNPFNSSNHRGTPDIPLNTLLKALDRHSIYLPSRYNNVYWCPNEIHLTSVYPPEDLYTFEGSETEKQLLRRINYIVYHYMKDGQHKEYWMTTEEYMRKERVGKSDNPFNQCYTREVSKSRRVASLFDRSNRRNWPTTDIVPFAPVLDDPNGMLLNKLGLSDDYAMFNAGSECFS